MRHHEMMMQKMRNNPKIRDTEEVDYRAKSTVKVDEKDLGLQQQINAHKSAEVLDHPDKSVTEEKLDDGAASDRAIGERLIDQSAVPDETSTGMLTVLLSWLANRIKAITGANFWYSDPAVTLVATKTHIDDKENPHETTAEQVPFTPVGGVVAEDVQAALTELDEDLTAHMTDPAAAHQASAISFAPGGNVLATTVQAAILELDTEKETPAGAQEKANAAQTAAEATAQAALEVHQENYPSDVKLRKTGSNLEVSLDGGATWHTVTIV